MTQQSAILLAALAYTLARAFASTVDEPVLRIPVADFTQSITRQATLECVSSRLLNAPGFAGERVLIWLAPEGALVKRGDVVARFDPSPVEKNQEVFKEKQQEAADQMETFETDWSIRLDSEGIRIGQIYSTLVDADRQKTASRFLPEIPRSIASVKRDILASQLQGGEKKIALLENAGERKKQSQMAMSRPSSPQGANRRLAGTPPSLSQNPALPRQPSSDRSLHTGTPPRETRPKSGVRNAHGSRSEIPGIDFRYSWLRPHRALRLATPFRRDSHNPPPTGKGRPPAGHDLFGEHPDHLQGRLPSCSDRLGFSRREKPCALRDARWLMEISCFARWHNQGGGLYAIASHIRTGGRIGRLASQTSTLRFCTGRPASRGSAPIQIKAIWPTGKRSPFHASLREAYAIHFFTEVQKSLACDASLIPSLQDNPTAKFSQ
jgi:hypothetical protein